MVFHRAGAREELQVVVVAGGVEKDFAVFENGRDRVSVTTLGDSEGRVMRSYRKAE